MEYLTWIGPRLGACKRRTCSRHIGCGPHRQERVLKWQFDIALARIYVSNKVGSRWPGRRLTENSDGLELLCSFPLIPKPNLPRNRSTASWRSLNWSSPSIISACNCRIERLTTLGLQQRPWSTCRHPFGMQLTDRINHSFRMPTQSRLPSYRNSQLLTRPVGSSNGRPLSKDCTTLMKVWQSSESSRRSLPSTARAIGPF